MLYKNPNGRRLIWRCGAGPGVHIDYIAEAEGFVDGPEGYREQFRRAGFIPADELPEDERPNFNFGRARVGITPQAPRRQFDDSADDDDDLRHAQSSGIPSMPNLDDIPSLDALPARNETIVPPATEAGVVPPTAPVVETVAVNAAPVIDAKKDKKADEKKSEKK